MILQKVISGGQTGADQGGLAGAQLMGVSTGGTAPAKFYTELGPAPDLLKGFGLIEGPHDARVYPIRTERNVRHSTGTVIFGNIKSAGSKLTLNLCMLHKKSSIINPEASELALWIYEKSIVTLNVAGNRESTYPGIGENVRGVISEAISFLRLTD